MPVNVASFNHELDRIEWKPIEAYERSGGRPSVKIIFSDGRSIEGTADHPIYIHGIGYIDFDAVLPGQTVASCGKAVGEVAVVSVEEIESPDFVYNLRVADNHNYFAEGILVHNCDDPHNIQQRESELVREATLIWWDETMSTRLNDQKTGCKVIVMQRAHEKDLSGHVLTQGGYVHLCLPAEFEVDRKCVTQIGWQDPRTEPGQLLWPDRHGPPEISELKIRLGSAAFAGQFQQSPTPSGGSRFKREWFRYFKRDVLREPSGDVAIYRLIANDGSARMVRALDCSRFAIVDPAGAEKNQDSRPCFTVVGIFDVTPSGDLLWLDVWRQNVSVPDACNAIGSLYAQYDLPWIGVEKNGIGLGVVQTLKKKGYSVRPIVARGAKESRSETAEIRMEAGAIFFLTDAPWLSDLTHELELFPVGEFCDQVDVLAYAAQWVNRHVGAIHTEEDNRELANRAFRANQVADETVKEMAVEERLATYNPAGSWMGYEDDD